MVMRVLKALELTLSASPVRRQRSAPKPRVRARDAT